MDWKMIDLETIDSTNLEARRLIEAGAHGPGLVVRARHQTAGRGRLQRDWLDQPGLSLLFTVALDGMAGTEATRLACVAAVAAIRREAGTGPLIKWPNDLVYGTGKVAGVLAEALPGKGPTLVGVGINVNYPKDEPAYPGSTSILAEEGTATDPGRLLGLILEEMEKRLPAGGAALADEYASLLAYLGEEVRVLPPFSIHGETQPRSEPLRGVMKGVDGEGLLLLEAEGAVCRVMAGDMVPGRAEP